MCELLHHSSYWLQDTKKTPVEKGAVEAAPGTGVQKGSSGVVGLLDAGTDRAVYRSTHPAPLSKTRRGAHDCSGVKREWSGDMLKMMTGGDPRHL